LRQIKFAYLYRKHPFNSIALHSLTQLMFLHELLQRELGSSLQLWHLQTPALVLEEDDHVAMVAGSGLGRGGAWKSEF
jgi:hypothetical protein